MTILYNVDVHELFEVQKTIEAAMAKKAAECASPQKIEKMRYYLENVEKSLDSDAFLFAEKSFHECILTASENRIFKAMIDSLTDMLVEKRKESIKTFTNLQIPFDQHRKIFDAIEKRDPEGAEKAMLDHLEDIENRLSSADKPK